MSVGRLSQFGAPPVTDRVVTDRNRITGSRVTAGHRHAVEAERGPPLPFQFTAKRFRSSPRNASLRARLTRLKRDGN